MKLLVFLLILFWFPSSSFSQKIKPQKIARLPSFIRESSGLTPADSISVWTMNDSGGKNELYHIDLNGRLLDTLVIQNGVNHDWEDLAGNGDGGIFIGDMGNNSNRRRNLTICKVPHLPLSGDSIEASFISFRYDDQNQFPPPPSNWNFDCEAFFHYGDSLYLFSKNNSNPNDGYTKMYRLTDQPGNDIAELIDSLYLNEPVTSADISPDGKTMVLLTYFSLWVFKDFTGRNFLTGKVYQFPFKGLTQKEAICFINDSESLMTDERHFEKGGKLYKFDLRKLNYSHPGKRTEVPLIKRALYNLFNNPKAKYRKIGQSS